MKAVILAGGFGTKLKGVINDVPKPMALIAGKPFLEHELLFLREQGIREIIITVHHMGDVIKSYFGDGSRFQLDITYSEEEVPLGTAGAIKRAEKYLDDTFIVVNGDSYAHVDLKDLIEFHRIKKNKSTIALTISKNSSDYGKAILQENKIIDFSEKENEISDDCLVNSGIYIFEPAIFDYIESYKHVSLEREVFPKLAKERALGGYVHNGYFIDIGKPETYYQFKKDMLRSLFMNKEQKVREAMEKITKSGIDFIMVVDNSDKLLGVLNDRIIKSFMLRGGNIEDQVSLAMITNPEKVANIKDDSYKIYDLLFSGTRHLPILDEEGRVIDVEFRSEKIKTESFPIIRGKAPLRISFAGGGTDLPSFFEKYGGVVINGTINKYCYATITKRADSKIIINSDIGKEAVFNLKEELKYDGNFDIIKAIINVMKPNFGFELCLYNDIPPGRGLGSSASLAVLLVKLISTLQGIEYDDYKIAEIAHRTEVEELKIKGGWQDQYAAVTGGFSFMEFNLDKTLIYPLRLKEEIIEELNHHMLICYVGKSHFSGDQQEVLEKVISEEEVINSLNELKRITVEIRDSLLTSNLENIGRLLHRSWENKKKVSSKITNPNIDRLYEIGIRNGAYGGKLLGAGGGGYILFFYAPEKRNNLVKALKEAGGEITDFQFDFKGTRIWWVSKNKVC